MEERSVAILTILIIFIFFMIFYKKSTDIKVDESISNISILEESTSEELNIISLDQYPVSAVWKINETLKLGDFKESINGLYKLVVENENINGNIFTSLNSYNPKYDKLKDLANNPMRTSLAGPGSIFTLVNNGIKYKDNIDGKGINRFVTNIYNNKLISNLPNSNSNPNPNSNNITYNSYNNDGTLNQLILSPQKNVNINNYNQYFKDVTNVDYIVFMNDGVKAFDKDNNLLFVDIF